MVDENRLSADEQAYREERIRAADLKMHISKELLSQTLKYAYETSNRLQTISGILLTAYLTIGIAAAKFDWGIKEVPWYITMLPVIFLALSMVTSFLSSYYYQGVKIDLGDLDKALAAYDEIVKSRRDQVGIPIVLLAFAVVSLIGVFFYIVYGT